MFTCYFRRLADIGPCTSCRFSLDRSFNYFLTNLFLPTYLACIAVQCNSHGLMLEARVAPIRTLRWREISKLVRSLARPLAYPSHSINGVDCAIAYRERSDGSVRRFCPYISLTYRQKANHPIPSHPISKTTSRHTAHGALYTT